jgi:hypothetical protein
MPTLSPTVKEPETVHRYQFDLPAALRLRGLIDEYGRLHRLEGMTPQVRGQRFNHFVADLRCSSRYPASADQPEALARRAFPFCAAT